MIKIVNTIWIVRSYEEILLAAEKREEALDIMIEREWITEKDKVRNPDTNEWTYLDILYGKDWKEVIKCLDSYTLEILFNNELFIENISVEKIVK